MLSNVSQDELPACERSAITLLLCREDNHVNDNHATKMYEFGDGAS